MQNKFEVFIRFVRIFIDLNVDDDRLLLLQYNQTQTRCERQFPLRLASRARQHEFGTTALLMRAPRNIACARRLHYD
jgi:hypothetical protein